MSKGVNWCFWGPTVTGGPSVKRCPGFHHPPFPPRGGSALAPGRGSDPSEGRVATCRGERIRSLRGEGRDLSRGEDQKSITKKSTPPSAAASPRQRPGTFPYPHCRTAPHRRTATAGTTVPRAWSRRPKSKDSRAALIGADTVGAVLAAAQQRGDIEQRGRYVSAGHSCHQRGSWIVSRSGECLPNRCFIISVLGDSSLRNGKESSAHAA